MTPADLLDRLLRKVSGLLQRLRFRPLQRKPALRIEDSVTGNFLICLETGTRHVTLKRHLRESLGLTPAEYRRRWGLPDNYPMVAANYLRRRNMVLGLGAEELKG